MFMLSPSEIQDILGEAKKFKIVINERDLRTFGRRATNLFKQQSITSELIQNMVDLPDDDDFKEDEDMADYDQDLSEELKTQKAERQAMVIKRIVT